jgi:hypothetical protein
VRFARGVKGRLFPTFYPVIFDHGDLIFISLNSPRFEETRGTGQHFTKTPSALNNVIKSHVTPSDSTAQGAGDRRYLRYTRASRF